MMTTSYGSEAEAKPRADWRKASLGMVEVRQKEDEGRERGRRRFCERGCLANEGKFEFYKEINAQIDQAFENVQSALTAAGGKGWDQVFRVNSYHVPLNNEALEAMVRNFRKWMPNHQPLWTCVGVTRLGEDDMRVEIEVQAYDPVKEDYIAPTRNVG